jgi:AAR2 protein
MARLFVGLTAAELTAQNLDKSALLDDAFQSVDGDADELLAEFQLAFVMFLYGQSLEGKFAIPCKFALRLCSLLMRSALTAPQSALKPHCARWSRSLDTGFAQWKSILQLVLACERAALQTHTGFFQRLLAVLRTQLEYGVSGKVQLVPLCTLRCAEPASTWSSAAR